MKSLAIAVNLVFAASAAARTFTVYNQCPFTIWYVHLSIVELRIYLTVC